MSSPRAAPSGSELRFPALVWAALHVPVVVWLYLPSLRPALRGLPPGYAAPMWPAVAAAALLLCLLVYLVPSPLSLAGRAYRWVAPAFAGLCTYLLSVDARLYAAVGFHVNGFFFQVLAQPAALKETGVPTREVVESVLLGIGWIAVEAAAGGWFLSRFRSRRRVWVACLAIVLLGALERVANASLSYFGGQSVYAAGQVLPLQAPLRMGRFWSRITGKPPLGNPLRRASAESALKFPRGVPPGDIHFTRRPDVLLLLMESTREDYLRPEIMPRLAARAAAQGMVFDHHYASAPATFFAVYGLLFGLHSHTFDAAVGTGRRPLLFGALAAAGYQSKIFAASSVDWMGLKETVFGDVQQELQTDWAPEVGPSQRDADIIDHALKAARAAGPDQPLFLFLFFDGTHFNYSFEKRSDRFRPIWDGKGVLKATDAPADQIQNRARNAAYELDWKMDDFIAEFERIRGRRPLALVTGDHAEEFREKGHLGHASALVREQIQVPMVITGDGVPHGRHLGATTHVDLVPTLFSLLGDRTPPALYGHGQVMFDAPDDRFVLVSIGWEPRYAVLSKDLKASFNSMDAGLGGVSITDADDKPMPDGDARFRQALPRILQLFSPPKEP